MTTVAYFDTNVYDHIYKRMDISDAELHSLRTSIEVGKINIIASILNLEEIIPILSNDELFKGELSLIIDLCNWDKLIKPTDLLLADDFFSFARYGHQAKPFLESNSRDHSSFIQNLQKFGNLNFRDKIEFLSIVKKVKEQKERFKKGMKEAQNEVLFYAKKLQDKPRNFHEFWSNSLKTDGLAWAFLESAAKRCKVLEECRAIGLASLLDIRSVRLYVGTSLSFIYGQLFEKKAPKNSDSRDLQHAVLASAADVFVINDSKFRRIVGRIPINDFKVIDLRSFLNQYVL